MYDYSSIAFMYYYDNPKGMIPTWLINWAAKVLVMMVNVSCNSHVTHFTALSHTQTGVPQFIETMRKGVFGYKDFLEEKRKELGVEMLDNVERLKKLYRLEGEP